MSLQIKHCLERDLKRLDQLKLGSLFMRLDVNGNTISHIWRKVRRIKRIQPLYPFVDCGLVGRFEGDVYELHPLPAYEFVMQVHLLKEKTK